MGMTRIFKMAGWVTMMGLASLIALSSVRYFVVSPEMAIDGPLARRFAEYITPLLFHVGGGVVALSLGAWGFWGRFRNKYLWLHRWLGRVYLLAVLVGGTAGFYMALTAFGGLPARIGFAMLALLWLATGANAYLRIRRGEVRLHREWMIRNYALTFSAVMLRVWLPLFLALGYDFPEAYTTVAWLCWVPNLLAAELIVGGGRRAGRALLESAPRRDAFEV
jgi:uncharacterized membrane protein